MHSHTNTVANSIRHPVYSGSVPAIQERIRHWAKTSDKGWYISDTRKELEDNYGFMLANYKSGFCTDQIALEPLEVQKLFLLFVAEALPDLIS